VAFAIEQRIDGAGAVWQQQRQHLLADLQGFGEVGAADQQVAVAAEQGEVVAARVLSRLQFLEQTRGFGGRGFGRRGTRFQFGLHLPRDPEQQGGERGAADQGSAAARGVGKGGDEAQQRQQQPDAGAAGLSGAEVESHAATLGALRKTDNAPRGSAVTLPETRSRARPPAPMNAIARPAAAAAGIFPGFRAASLSWQRRRLAGASRHAGEWR
jgi:hypothetical protein